MLSQDVKFITAKDGVKLRVSTSGSDLDTPRGTVLIFPGRTEYIEKYALTVDYFSKENFSTLTIDWRGQGASDRIARNTHTSHVESFTDYQLDVAAMVAAAEDMSLPKPFFLLGHSMGATIGLRALMDGLEVSACAFTAALWDIKISPIERIAAWPLSWAAQAFGKGDVFAPGNKAQEAECYVKSVPFTGNRLTSSQDMFDYMVGQADDLPELQIGAPSLGWLFQALKETRDLRKRPSPGTPCVAFCGTDDRVIELQSIESRMENWTNGSFIKIRNGRHDLLCEEDHIRDTVFTKIVDLFNKSII